MRNFYKKIYYSRKNIYNVSIYMALYLLFNIEDSDGILLYEDWFLILIEIKCEIKSKQILYKNKNSLSPLRLIWQ